MIDWLTESQRILVSGEEAVLVSVASVRGSAPRETGARMLVTTRKTLGTIGGGQLEYQCSRIAARLMREHSFEAGGARIVRRFPLGSNCGQCCGGVVDILFEPVVADSRAWIDKATELHEERRSFVIATALGRPTTELICSDERFFFGDGPTTDDELVDAARLMLSKGGAARIESPAQHPAIRVLLDPVGRSRFQVALFGAGHVGSAVVDVLSRLDCDIRWIDSRRNIFPAGLARNVQSVESECPEREVSALPAASFYLIMTHSHAMDFAICQQILARGDFEYCGLIGSISKRRRFERLMRQQGMAASVLTKLTCPIGVDGISGKRPAEIAVSVAAELLRLIDAQSIAAKPGSSRNLYAIAASTEFGRN